MAPASEPLPTETVGRRTHPATAAVRAWLWLLAGGAWLAQRLITDPSARTSPTLAGGVLAGAVALGVAYGLVGWLTTRYVIDGTELRIDSGLLARRSRRVPYERLQGVDIAQPFGARLLGLAELRIEMAGGDSSHVNLAFLQRVDAERLREVLLARAGTDPATGDGAGDRNGANRPDQRSPATVIATVPPGRLLAATALSSEFLSTLAVGMLLLAVAAVSVALTDASALAFAPPLLLAVGGNLYRLVSRGVVDQWGATLSRVSHGVRVERGLTSRSSQTVARGRVQGIAVEQPVLWRSPGWYRVVVDVAGQGRGRDGDSDDAASTSTLLPVADGVAVRAVLTEVAPGAEPGAAALLRAPGRARWLSPLQWRQFAAGADDLVFEARKGWLTRCTEVVPHARTQSVALRQGPLQRALGLATTEVHSPDGPVEAVGRHLTADDARTLAIEQLGRARSARVP